MKHLITNDYIIKLHRSGMSSRAISLQCDISYYNVLKLINANGGHRALSEQCSTYAIDRHFFDAIDTEHKAYWFGFIASDGYVQHAERKNGHVDKRLVIKLARKDEQHLRSFRVSVGSNHPIRRDSSTCSSRLNINSAELVGGLINNGIVTYKKEGVWPTVDANLTRHFIRGLFDGDGWASIPANGYLTIGFCNPFRGPVETVRGLIGLDASIHWQRGVWRWDKAGSGCKKAYQYLYDDATVWLHRKRRNFEKCIDLSR